MDTLLNILKTFKPNVDFESSQDIISEGLLTSIEIINLVYKLNDAFDIEIGVTEMRPENFKSVNTMLSMIERLEEE